MAFRIAHFTDIHITESAARIPWSALLSKRFIGWLNLRLLGRGRHFEDAATITGALVKDLRELSPHHILFTGDVTGLSLESEFESAREILEPLLGDPRVTGIPGNHDVYVPRVVKEKRFEKHFGDWLKTDVEIGDFPRNLRDPFPFPLLRYLGDEVALLCLNDVRATALYDSSGIVSEIQLQALEHLLGLDEVARRVKILALHYAPRRPDGSGDRYFHRLRNAEAVLALAEKARVDLIVHGHIHHRMVHLAGTAAGTAITTPGSLTYEGRDRAYHLYVVAGGEIRLETRRFNPESGRFEAWENAPGNGRIAYNAP